MSSDVISIIIGILGHVYGFLIGCKMCIPSLVQITNSAGAIAVNAV